MRSINNDLKPQARAIFGHVQDKLSSNLAQTNYVEGKLLDNPMSL